MKVIPAAFAFLLLALGGAAHAQGNDGPYINALNNLSGKCETMAYKAGLDESLVQKKISYGQAGEDEFTTTLDNDSKKIRACIASARKGGAKIYKSFIAKEKNPKIKKDMKAVFVAWLSYLPERVGFAHSNYEGRDNSRIAAAAYKKAVSTLQVDKLTE